ncbi:MAG: hypothetical protein HQ512_08155 [Rhodospirillales bacterium]|nr:hypothetical protein [Rhodospirillales bacterium]
MLGIMKFSGAFSLFAATWLAAAWLAVGTPAHAAARCPQSDAGPDISLEVTTGRVVYDNARSRKQLKVLQNNGKISSSRRGWQPIGLTLTELQFRMNISVNTLSQPGGGNCAVISGVKARLGFGKITVYVDKRYRRGSCQYNSVLEHENEHVEIFRETLDQYATLVEDRLIEAAANLKPVFAKTAQHAAQKLQNTLQSKVEPMFKKMNQAIDRKNDTIDTPANYKREQKRCPKW